MAQYTNFIPENTAPKGARRIGIYNADGNRVGQIPLGNLSVPDKGGKMYSFGVLSDPHVGEDEEKIKAFEQALKYLGNNADISFICICGDLVFTSNEDNWEAYDGAIRQNANGKKVYAIAGNHEQHEKTALTEQYTGLGVLSSFTIKDDAFIMLGCYRYAQQKDQETGNVIYQRQKYTADDLRRIYAILEENKNRRCFVFQHVQPSAGLDELNIVEDMEINKTAHLPQSAFRHYENVTVFHGHTHRTLSAQKSTFKGANYDESLGFRSVHVSSVGDHNEGYIVDVYQKGIHLQGFKFDTGECMPIASYWINTETVKIMGDTYVPEV